SIQKELPDAEREIPLPSRTLAPIVSDLQSYLIGERQPTDRSPAPGIGALGHREGPRSADRPENLGTGRESLADFELGTVRRGSPDPAVSGTAGLPAGVATGDLRSAGWQGRETLPQLGPWSRPFREVSPGPFP